MLENDVIPFENMFSNHGIALDFEGKGARTRPDSNGFDIDGNASLRFLLAILGPPGGNASVKRDLDHPPPPFFQRRTGTQSAGAARGAFENPFLTQRGNVAERGIHAFKTKMGGDLP